MRYHSEYFSTATSSTALNEFGELINGSLYTASVQSLSGDSFEMDVHTVELDSCIVRTFSGGGHFAVRDAAHIERDPRNDVFISLVIEGTASYYSERVSEVVYPGEAIAYHPGVPYSISFSYGVRQLFVSVSLPVTEGPPSLPFTARRLSLGQIERLGATNMEMLDLYQSIASGSFHRAVQMGPKLRSLAMDASKPLRGDYPRMAREFIEKNCRNCDLSAVDVAKSIGISTRQLNRILAAEGVSIGALILNSRMEIARRLLVEGRVGIAETARSSGFNSDVYFARAFSKVHGCSPSFYRKTNLER